MLGDCVKKMVLMKQIDETGLMASNGRIMEKPGQEQAFKCPRCDSSNTKFCYYNNYSLSQPRHFCKACKRYWTRGGTLRNVPVGGGCRKNKRVKRSAPSTGDHSSPHIDHHISNASNHINPLFYGLPSNLSDINLTFQRSSYDLQPELSEYRSGFNPNTTQIQDILTSNSLFGSTHQFQALLPFEDLKIAGNHDQGSFMKEGKMEQIGSSDPYHYWNTNPVGSWPDLTNFGSSVTSFN